MMKTHKGPTVTIGILLIACLALLVRGIVADPFCWFTGAKLVVWLALISIWAKQFGATSVLQKILVQGAAISALLVGIHLLVPYFWAVRVNDGLYLTAFLVFSGLAWLYSVVSMEKEEYENMSYRFFCYLPAVVFIGCLLAVNTFAGSLYAALLLGLYYFLLGAMFLKEGIVDKIRGKFNIGLLLMLLAVAGKAVDYDLSQLTDWRPIGAVIIIFLLANLGFIARNKAGRRVKK